MTARTLHFENAILDLFENNRITIQDAKIVLWTLLTAIYEDEMIEEPHGRETIIENIKTEGTASCEGDYRYRIVDRRGKSSIHSFE